MGFSKNTNPNIIDLKFRLGAYPGTEFRLPVRLLKLKDRQAITQSFLGLSEAEYDEVRARGTILGASLVEEPSGFDDFPVDERPLQERGAEYFADLPAEFDAAICEAYTAVVGRGRADFSQPSA